MLVDKIKYGCRRFFEDISGKEDYWHCRLPYISERADYNYYLSFLGKSNYPFKTDIHGIPIVLMNGVDQKFSITIFNYGLGLIDNYGNLTSEDKRTLKNLLDWTVSNQNDEGEWRNMFEVPSMSIEHGWISAMGQGLGISFIYRCYLLNLISFDLANNVICKAFSVFSSPKLHHIINDTDFILQEFGGLQEDVLNGYIFSIIGLYDFGRFTSDFSSFEYHINVLKKILPQYDFYGWSYYSGTKIVSSVFYHQLHIDLLMCLKELTGDVFFERYIQQWSLSNRFRAFFITIKAIQKTLTIQKLNTLDQ